MKTTRFLALAATLVALTFTSSLAGEEKSGPLANLKYGGKILGGLQNFSLNKSQVVNVYLGGTASPFALDKDDLGMGWGFGVGGTANYMFTPMFGAALELNFIYKQLFNAEGRETVLSTPKGIRNGKLALEMTELALSIPIMAQIKPVSSLGLIILAGVQLDFPVGSEWNVTATDTQGDKWQIANRSGGAMKGSVDGRSGMDFGLVAGVGYIQSIAGLTLGVDFKFTQGLTEGVSDKNDVFGKSKIGQQFMFGVSYYL
jgi:hypothetical protein